MNKEHLKSNKFCNIPNVRMEKFRAIPRRLLKLHKQLRLGSDEDK